MCATSKTSYISRTLQYLKMHGPLHTISPPAIDKNHSSLTYFVFAHPPATRKMLALACWAPSPKDSMGAELRPGQHFNGDIEGTGAVPGKVWKELGMKFSIHL